MILIVDRTFLTFHVNEKAQVWKQYDLCIAIQIALLWRKPSTFTSSVLSKICPIPDTIWMKVSWGWELINWHTVVMCRKKVEYIQYLHCYERGKRQIKDTIIRKIVRTLHTIKARIAETHFGQVWSMTTEVGFKPCNIMPINGWYLPPVQ